VPPPDAPPDLSPADLALGLEVQRALDRAVRPLLNVDAGDVEISAVRDGRVELTLLGSCGRCAFKPACVVNRVLPVLEERFDAHFDVRGVPRPRSLVDVALYRAEAT
jgi:Fe-S cluster biogenesis protein NfuA